VPAEPLPGQWNLEPLERSNTKNNQGTILEDIVVAEANRSLARTIYIHTILY